MITDLRVVNLADRTLLEVPGVAGRGAAREARCAALCRGRARSHDVSGQHCRSSISTGRTRRGGLRVRAPRSPRSPDRAIRDDVYRRARPDVLRAARATPMRWCVRADRGRRDRDHARDARRACASRPARPAFLVDMDEHTIPLEAGIEDRAISFTKGCYVGQEVIVRVMHRGHGRVAKKLVGLLFEKSATPHAGDLVGSDKREIGRLTSVVWSPALERPIALGYVHRDFVEEGHSGPGDGGRRRPASDRLGSSVCCRAVTAMTYALAHDARLLLAAALSRRASDRRRIGCAHAASVRRPAPTLQWYKGNTHTHTINSDGDSTPDEVVRWYREHALSVSRPHRSQLPDRRRRPERRSRRRREVRRHPRRGGDDARRHQAGARQRPRRVGARAGAADRRRRSSISCSRPSTASAARAGFRTSIIRISAGPSPPMSSASSSARGCSRSSTATRRSTISAAAVFPGWKRCGIGSCRADG